MPLSALLPLFAVLALSALWISRRLKGRLLDPDELISRIFPGESIAIEKYTLSEQADIIENDIEFWTSCGGWRGLIRKRHNAVCFVQLCQQLSISSQFEKEEIDLIRTRAILITFYLTCSIPEAIVRWFVRSIPHSSARMSAQLYWDIERRMTTLCSISRPDLLDQLHQIL